MSENGALEGGRWGVLPFIIRQHKESQKKIILNERRKNTYDFKNCLVFYDKLRRMFGQRVTKFKKISYIKDRLATCLHLKKDSEKTKNVKE